MNEQELALELAHIQIPGGDAALERCLSAYRGPPPAPLAAEPSRRRPVMRFRLAVAAAVAAGIVALASTPPGRAAADWVADLIGIADVGEAPTVAPAPTVGDEPRPPRATVIASGLTARGDPFEWVLDGTSRGTCLTLLLPARGASEAGGACGEDLFLPLRGDEIFPWGSSGLGRGENVVYGFISPTVASVKLTFDHDGQTATLDAVTEQIPLKLLRQAGADRPRGVFIAFLPLGVLTSEVTATAYDTQGEALGSASWPSL
jgi:hypothetical protein